MCVELGRGNLEHDFGFLGFEHLKWKKKSKVSHSIGISIRGFHCTWIEEKNKLEADVISAIELQIAQFVGQIGKGVGHGWDP